MTHHSGRVAQSGRAREKVGFVTVVVQGSATDWVLGEGRAHVALVNAAKREDFMSKFANLWIGRCDFTYSHFSMLYGTGVLGVYALRVVEQCGFFFSWKSLKKIIEIGLLEIGNQVVYIRQREIYCIRQRHDEGKKA